MEEEEEEKEAMQQQTDQKLLHFPIPQDIPSITTTNTPSKGANDGRGKGPRPRTTKGSPPAERIRPGSTPVANKDTTNSGPRRKERRGSAEASEA